MKLTFFLLLATATLALSEYPRMKYRGPPVYPKPPPYQQISKKWQQPPRPLTRSRPPPPRSPIPVHMPTNHKIQMGAASINRPVALPVRNFWKNTQTTFRPQEKHRPVEIKHRPVEIKHRPVEIKHRPVEIKHRPVEIHRPLDNRPAETHYATSAPVLPKKVFQSSPAILAQEYNFQIQSNNIPTPIKTIKQIGEKGPIHTIPAPNLSLADKPLVVEEVKPKKQYVEEVKHHVQLKPESATYVQIQKAHQYQVTESPEPFKAYFEQQQNVQPAELYQLINAYPNVPLLPDLQPSQDYLQQFPAILAQPSQNYVEQVVPEQYAMDKSYEEPKKDKKEAGLVTAGYNLEPEVAESIVQSQYVQNYFDTREKNNDDENNEEVDAKNDKNENESGYYVSLPNKEAAETLASLQAAGKLNSNLNQRAQGGDSPVSIYVPDEDSREEGGLEGEENYEDYPQEDLIPEEMNRGGDEFGHRLKPK